MNFLRQVTSPSHVFSHDDSYLNYRLDKEEKLIGKFMKMISNWKFLCPFLINQCGSIMYYLSMGKNFKLRRGTLIRTLGQYPISIAVTMVNALTLVVTTLTSYAIGESKLSFDEFIGMTLVLSGIILCKL